MATGETEIVMKKIMSYNDANDFGFVSAGDVAKLADMTAELLAASYYKSLYLTVCLDNLVFKQPIRVKDEVHVKANINYVRKTSMEVGIKIEVTNHKNNKTSHVTSMYAVLVAVDTNLLPQPIPQLKIKNATQERRFEEAVKRMEKRIELKKGK
jgi:acyl-CoA hydrolase